MKVLVRRELEEYYTVVRTAALQTAPVSNKAERLTGSKVEPPNPEFAQIWFQEIPEISIQTPLLW